MVHVAPPSADVNATADSAAPPVSVYAPTAMHSVAVGHTLLERLHIFGGHVPVDHVVPPSWVNSAKGGIVRPGYTDPTAAHRVAVGHEIPP